jgi:uncharacterized protein (DUF305 family)
MITIPTRRTLAVAAVTVVAGLGASGCGGSHDGDHGSKPIEKTDARSPGSPAAVDKAFVAQMIPHHQMAVQMAETAVEKGERPEITKLARSIVASQSKEIRALKAVATQLGVTPAAVPSGGMDHGAMDHGSHGGSSMATDAKTLGIAMDQMGMSMDMAALEKADPFDRAFIDDMVPHHQGAIRMARAELQRGGDAELKRLAQEIIAAQQEELTEMTAWKKEWFGAR